MFQKPVVAASTQDLTAKLGELRAKASELKLKASDLEVRKSQLGDRRRRQSADVDPTAIEKQQAAVEHELASTHIQLEALNHQIGDLQTERDLARDLARVFSLPTVPGAPSAPGAPIAITEPPSDPFLGPKEIMTVGSGLFILTLPLVLVMARRLWIRSTPNRTRELEDSPRLQRIEQAVESIALEVERIGEAQRFTTKLFAERQADHAPLMPAAPRREPGTITPH